MLAEHPKRIAAATAGVSAARLRDEAILGAWSARDILGHLRACADARGDFIPRIIAERRPTLRAIDPGSLLERSDYLEVEFAPSFRAFVRQRAKLVKFLKALPRKDWSRTAIITGGGIARERTVLFYAQWLARHEPAHVRHIEQFAQKVATAR